MEDLEALYATRETARRFLEALGMTNAYGLSAAEAIEFDLRYDRAKRDFVAADRAYREAITAATERAPA